MPNDYSPQQAAALISWYFAEHGSLRYLAELSVITGLSIAEACALTRHLAEVLPLQPAPVGWRVEPNGTRPAPTTNLQRAAVIAWHLAAGRTLTTRQAAELLGLARNSTYTLLDRLSLVIPIRDYTLKSDPARMPFKTHYWTRVAPLEP